MESDFSVLISSDQAFPQTDQFTIKIYQANETVKTASFVFDFARKEVWDAVEVIPNPLIFSMEDSE